MINFKRIILIVLLFLIPVKLILSQESTQGEKPIILISYQMGITSIPQEGEEEDYRQGFNPFPVVPSHTVKTVNGEIFVYLYRNLFLGFSLDYCMNTRITVIDPSDDDSFQFNTLSFYNYYLSLRYKYKLFGISSYFSIGVGRTLTNGAESETITTNKGYSLLLEKIDSYSQMLYVSNFGLELPLGESIYLTGKISYLRLNMDKDSYLQFLGGIKFIILKGREVQHE